MPLVELEAALGLTAAHQPLLEPLQARRLASERAQLGGTGAAERRAVEVEHEHVLGQGLQQRERLRLHPDDEGCGRVVDQRLGLRVEGRGEEGYEDAGEGEGREQVAQRGRDGQEARNVVRGDEQMPG